MNDQLYIYDCLTGKLRVSNGDFMAIGAGKQNTFRIKTEAESAGVFAQRNGVCRFFPHNKHYTYSINSKQVSTPTLIKPENFYLLVLSGGLIIAWFGSDDSRPDFGNFDPNCWYIYTPETDQWSDALDLELVLSRSKQSPGESLATFDGLGHNAYLLSDLQQVADFYLNSADYKDKLNSPADNPRKNGFRCPSCHELFSAEQVLGIAVHPQLRGDIYLGENAMQRFTPATYNDKGQALDEMGAQCSEFACPHCHHKLPPFFEQTTHHHITILGAPTAGKVYYQAALIHQLERELPRDFNIPFRDATPESNTALNNMRIRTFYSSTPEEFREGRDMMHHALRRKVWRNNVFELVPRPFIYNLTKESSAHSLIFYNTGNRESAQPVLPQIRKGEADAIFYLYDPTLEPSFREVIRDFATIPQQAPGSNTVCSQSQLLSVAEMHIRTALNVPPGEKINIPISVIVTKCDIWKQLLGPEPLLPIVRNGRLKPQNLLRNSLRIRDLLFHLAPEVCSQAESLSTRVNYFAVSSFGNPPEEFSDELTGETYIAPAGGRLSPFHVTDPVLWFLYNTDIGMFPEN